jgi:predicted RNase H-like nuclease
VGTSAGGGISRLKVRSVVGIDLFKGQWLASEVRLSQPSQVHFLLGPTLIEVIAAFPTAEVIAVDIPIGLGEGGPRAADSLAATFIETRSSSVFRMPPRDVLMADTHQLAVELARRRHMPAPSIQAYGLRERIFEAAAAALQDPRVIEIHPEVSFRAMAGRPLKFSKKSWNGSMERRRLLASAGIAIPNDIGPAGSAAVDDVLDACAAAWSAERVLLGTGSTLPDPPETIAGRSVAIWY